MTQLLANDVHGYREALRFARRHADGARVWAIEGARHYGAGFTRYLNQHTETVLEVSRSLRSERRGEARETFARLLDFATRESSTLSLELTGALSGIALAADPLDAAQAARLRGASATIRANANLIDQPHFPRVEHRLEQHLTEALGPELWERERAAGAALTLEETIALARSLAGKPPADASP